MKRFLSLFVVMLIGLVPMMAQDASGTLVKGDRIPWSELKAGDEILLQNASGTWDLQYSSVVTDLTICFLQGVPDNYNRSADTHQLDCSMAALSSDNIYIVVEAPEQHEGVPSYYLQHKDTKKYVQGVESGLQTFLVDNIAEATSFEVEGALDSYEPHNQWQSTGLVDNETGVLTHYNGDTKLHFGPFWNYGYTYYGPATDIIVWNFYRTAYDQSAKAKLGALLDEIKADGNTFTIGTEPGYYPEEQVKAYENTYLDADDYYVNGADVDEEYAKHYEQLKTAYDNIKDAYIKVTDGYYHFISGYDAYKTIQGVDKAMTVDTDHNLAWGTYDAKDPSQLFKVTQLAEGEYSVQNVATGEYINTKEGTSAIVPMSKEQTTPQTFTYLRGSVQWNIANKANDQAYHTQGHQSGVGISGQICTWNGGAGGASGWLIFKVTDQQLIDSLVKAGPQRALNDRMKVSLASAQTAKDKVFDYPELITDGNQISSNALQDGVYSNLIDGDINTIFHSIWDAETMKSELGEGVGYHNLQIALSEPVDKLFFRYTGLTGTDFHDNPNNIGVYVTNDDELGASTAAADSTKWVHVTDLTEGFPDDVRAAKYTSPLLTFDQAYKYVRLVVRHTTHQGKHSERTFMNPFSTGVTFNLSELQLYKPDYAETSEYSNVNGMKEAADNMLQLMTTGEEKVKNNTVTEADIEALNAAIKAVDALYVNRDSLYTELVNTVSEAQSTYTDALGSKQTLITDASQFSSNNGEGMPENDSSFEHLLSPETHYSYNYHSFFIADAMSNAAITPDEWMQALADAGAPYTGYGYHNLQVKLNQPVSNFWFEYIGRTGTTYVDNPTDIEVYVTNDDELGADPDQANIDQWTKVTELTEGFPGAEPGAKYTSPVLELGGEYKYVRFVIKNAALNGTKRTFANPDVTGITWNVACWQMYNGLDPQRVQYNYNEDLHKAVDAMKALIDDANATSKKTLLTNDKQTALRSAIDLVLSLYADTTELAQLYKRYTENVANSVVDESKALGFVDSQEAIDAFATAVSEAKASVDPVQPTRATVDAAVAKMNDAYKTFMTHVGQIVPNQWYTFISGSTREFAQNQPIFLGSLNVGGKLYIGGYPIDTKAPETDPYSVWRFVPIEGSEGQYAIQSLGTGQYMGKYRGQGGDASPVMQHEKAPYNIYYFGNGMFKVQQADAPNQYFNSFKTDGSTNTILNWASNGDNQQAFKFVPITDPEASMDISVYQNNSLKVMTLPFELKAGTTLMDINEGTVKTYAVKALTTSEEGTRLELKLKKEFAAGEPFIIEVGDYTQFGDGSEQQGIQFLIPETVTDTSAIVANGLVGTLQGETIAKPGMGIFVNSQLKASEKNAGISGREGYIIPQQVVNEEGEADLVIETGESITGIKNTVVLRPTDKVNVYTIDGKLIKRNVKATEAGKNLKKGIYIIGKRKVAVK